VINKDEDGFNEIEGPCGEMSIPVSGCPVLATPIKKVTTIASDRPSMRYAMFRDNGSLNRQALRRTNDLEVRVVSDEPLTSKQKDLFQDCMGLDPIIFQRANTIEVRRLGKFITIMRMYPV